jgi:hypothetical protein
VSSTAGRVGEGGSDLPAERSLVWGRVGVGSTSTMLWFLALVLLVLAIVGGIALSHWLFLVLLVVVVVGFFARAA